MRTNWEGKLQFHAQLAYQRLKYPIIELNSIFVLWFPFLRINKIINAHAFDSWIIWGFAFNLKFQAVLKSSDFGFDLDLDFHCHGSQKRLTNQQFRACDLYNWYISDFGVMYGLSRSHLANRISKTYVSNGELETEKKNKSLQEKSQIFTIYVPY